MSIWQSRFDHYKRLVFMSSKLVININSMQFGPSPIKLSFRVIIRVHFLTTLFSPYNHQCPILFRTPPSLTQVLTQSPDLISYQGSSPGSYCCIFEQICSIVWENFNQVKTDFPVQLWSASQYPPILILIVPVRLGGFFSFFRSNSILLESAKGTTQVHRKYTRETPN